MKKACKIIAIIIAVVGAIAAAYVVVTKFLNKKKSCPEENFVSCSCDDEFASETVS